MESSSSCITPGLTGKARENSRVWGGVPPGWLWESRALGQGAILGPGWLMLPKPRLEFRQLSALHL